MLIRFRGVVGDSLHAFALCNGIAEAGGVHKVLDRRFERRAYLGRYMGASPSEIEAMPGRDVARYVASISEIVKAENGTGTKEK